MTSRTEIAETLRRRIVTLVRAGAVQPGDRLPSSRELAVEFHADVRVVQAAYRLLADDGLVVQRPRSGIFLRERRIKVDQLGVSITWLADLFSAALSRGIPAPQLIDVLRRALLSTPIRVVTVATTADQNEGMCRELRDDYGLQATCVSADAIGTGRTLPRLLTDAQLIVTTEFHVPNVRAVASRLGTPLIVGAVRRDLVGPAWKRLLLAGDSYVVVADRRFIAILQHYFGTVPAGHSIRYLVAGTDDLTRIPVMAPVYITSAARDMLGRRRIPGRVVPTARIFSPETAREILRFVVTKQLEAAIEEAGPALRRGSAQRPRPRSRKAR